jgi:hypothetical protein
MGNLMARAFAGALAAQCPNNELSSIKAFPNPYLQANPHSPFVDNPVPCWIVEGLPVTGLIHFTP